MFLFGIVVKAVYRTFEYTIDIYIGFASVFDPPAFDRSPCSFESERYFIAGLFAVFHITVFGILPISFQCPATVFVGIDKGRAFAVYQVGKRIFHRKGNRFLQYDGVTVFGYFTAIFHNKFFGVIRSAFHGFVESVAGVNERFVSDFFDSFSICLGECAESFDDT